MEINLKDKPWFDYLEEDLIELLAQSLELVGVVRSWNDHFHDYSFIVFPAAKAYEGYLKKMFIDLKFITREDYYGRRFRIGKALNPTLDEKFRDESIYDKIIDKFQDKSLADELWDTWKTCRNLIFHWFPEEKSVISYDEAVIRVEKIITAIDQSYRKCIEVLK